MRGRISVDSFSDADHTFLVECFAAANWIAQRIAVSSILACANAGGASQLTDSQLRVFSSQILNAVGTGLSIDRLVEPPSPLAKDALILSRTYFESILNACYVTISNQHAERANLHRIYCEFRSQTKFRNIGDISFKTFRTNPIPRNNKLVKKALLVLDPNGTGKPKAMFDKDRHERIKEIQSVNKNAALALFGAGGLIYDVSSQHSHAEQAAIDQFSSLSQLGDDQNKRILETAFIAMAACMLSLKALAAITKPHDLSDDCGHLHSACELFFKNSLPEVYGEGPGGE